MIPQEKYSDAELVERILQGEKALYEIFIRRYNPYLYKTGRSYNYNHEDTEDLMQDTFVDAYKSLSAFESRSSFKTWITKIMLNRCYHKKQKSGFRNEIITDAPEFVTPMFTHKVKDPSKIIQNKELGRVIEDALHAIPFDYRMVFSLREVSGFNVSETAALLEISESNVKVRLTRAKSMLRKEIEKKYSAGEIFEFNLVYCDAMVEGVMKRI
jgi:RNA polymerase sigma factor (sigma-70 family)